MGFICLICFAAYFSELTSINSAVRSSTTVFKLTQVSVAFFC